MSTTNQQIEKAAEYVVNEAKRACARHGKFNSAHEGYAVILEEVDELWDEVKKREKDERAMRKEVTQIAAMCLRFLAEIVPLEEYILQRDAREWARVFGADVCLMHLIAEERRRQVNKGYDAAHDDAHKDGEIACAAATYALYDSGPVEQVGDFWPWGAQEFKPRESAIENLVCAGALIIAEIERLQRLEAKKGN